MDIAETTSTLMASYCNRPLLLNAHDLYYKSSAYKLGDLDMVDFAAHFTIHAIKIGFQKTLHFKGKCCP